VNQFNFFDSWWSPQRKGIVMLLVVTLLWSSAFVIVKQSLVTIPPSVLSFVRFLIAALSCSQFLVWNNPQLWLAGFELSIWTIAGYGTQAIGLQYTTVNRSAFISSLYVIGVPLLARILGHQIGKLLWVAAAIALVGVGLLSYDGSPPNLGDIWTLVTALFYTVYIWRVEAHTKQFRVMALSAAQLWGAALLALLWIVVTNPTWLQPQASLKLPWLDLIYLGLIPTGLATWVQLYGQRFVNATQAGILYTLEPVWASVLAAFFLGERLGTQGLLGAGCIVGATFISQMSNAKPRSPLPPP
jgi:drug/metabolite transporter (DMT)-like permease